MKLTHEVVGVLELVYFDAPPEFPGGRIMTRRVSVDRNRRMHDRWLR